VKLRAEIRSTQFKSLIIQFWQVWGNH